MKILPLSKKANWALPEQEQIKKEFKEAKRFVEVRVGEQHMFHRNFLRIRVVPISECERLFLRIEMGEYGDFPLHVPYIVVKTKQNEELELQFEHQEDAKAALAYLEENHPEIKFGK